MQRSSRTRFFIAFLAMIGTALFLFFAWKIYLWKSGKEPDLIAEAVRQAEQKDYAIAMADTYGGKTPQETLQMYISAVEKRDYELASKYFIGANQEKELKSFDGSTSENLKNYLELWKKAEPWRSSLEEKEFTMETKIEKSPSLFIRFKIYPNCIWKIIEI